MPSESQQNLTPTLAELLEKSKKLKAQSERLGAEVAELTRLIEAVAGEEKKKKRKA
jgi:hypothetical protein